MTKKDITFPFCVGDSWAQFLTKQYQGRHAAKRIAQDFGCEPRTAKAWLSGQPPHISQLVRAGMLFGLSTVTAILFPDTIYHQKTALVDELAALHSRLEDLSTTIERLRHAEGI